ncbi:MAG: hypothetical protein BWY91_02987 [bacterium ADurb.BinA028]|nr:MAG: hypothetical protein BWY91_02987 [bacterium ADurb.BinA028]
MSMTFWVTSSVPAGAAAATGAVSTEAAAGAAATGAADGSGMPALPRIHPATCLIVGKSRSFIVSSRSTL